MKKLGQLGDLCTEGEMEFFAKVMQTDLALQLTPCSLDVFSLKVQEGA